MVIGKRTHDEATAPEDSSGNNNNNNNSNNNNSNNNSNNNCNCNNNNSNNNNNNNENENNMDIVEEKNNNNENDSNMDIVDEEQTEVLGSTEESMETSTPPTTTTEAPPAAAAVAAMMGDPTENEQHQQAQQEPPNRDMIVVDCAQKAVDHHLLSDYNEKARVLVAMTIVTHFNQQPARLSKDRLVSDLNTAFGFLIRAGVLPDDRLLSTNATVSTNATLLSNIVDSFWDNMIMMTVKDCAQKVVDLHLSDFDEKARDRVVKHIVAFFNWQAEKSKNQLASDLDGVFYSFFVDGVVPDARLSTNATLLSTIVDSFWHELTEQKILPETKPKGHIADLDFQIVESKLSHLFDVDAFIKRVCLTKETWEKQITSGNQELQMLYDAPYFCFIQSSGMGKTKIMFEAVHKLNKKDSSEYGHRWKCALVMPGSTLLHARYKRADANHGPVVFDYQIDFPERSNADSISKHTANCFAKLDALLKNVIGQPSPPDASSPTTSLPPQENCNSVLLCFDESHAFLNEINWNDGYKEKTEKAYFLRVIRLWLRLKRHRVTVVAVFTGTSTSIADFRFERDDAQIFRPVSVSDVLSSRDCRPREKVEEVHEKGGQFFPMFTNTTTIGCLAKSTRSSPQEDSSDGSYKRAIPYGRPLFAVLDQDGSLDDTEPFGVLMSILGRMLQVTRTNCEEWKENDVSWLSVLATRVQVGQTSCEVASQLVTRGYANLLGVSAMQVRITYMPDPVCARLAMGMMSDSFKLGSFRGTGGTFWAEKLSALFQRGLCIPEKGDAGEIFVALYFLLCGDILRTNDSFAIQLDKWIGLLMRGGSGPDDIVNALPISDSAMAVETEIETATGDGKADEKGRRLLPVEAKEKDTTDTAAAPVTLESGSEVSINFIQVCRNNLRSFDVDWVGFKNRSFCAISSIPPLPFMYIQGAH
jgi:hypothetical protein